MKQEQEDHSQKSSSLSDLKKDGPLYYPGMSGMFPLITGEDETHELVVERAIHWVLQRLRRSRTNEDSPETNVGNK